MKNMPAVQASITGINYFFSSAIHLEHMIRNDLGRHGAACGNDGVTHLYLSRISLQSNLML